MESDRQPNRLAREGSPYLRQHALNPVDWYPWGAEALDRARREDRPIFLSIGYSACHWCHVMEHESFENDEIARLMNELFVNIKVDREERPDLDRIYMTAVQMMTGARRLADVRLLDPRSEAVSWRNLLSAGRQSWHARLPARPGRRGRGVPDPARGGGAGGGGDHRSDYSLGRQPRAMSCRARRCSRLRRRASPRPSIRSMADSGARRSFHKARHCACSCVSTCERATPGIWRS